jgi:outer membrane protein with beta-barrel domain
MKNLLILLSGFLFACNAMALDLNYAPYIGVDGSYRMMSFKDGAGRNEFKNHLNGMTLFVGNKFIEYAGIEVGAHLSRWANKTEYKHKINSVHASVLGFYPITSSLDAIGGIGVSQSKLIAKDKVIINKLSNKKVHPRISAGLQYSINEYVGLRAMYNFENTAKLKKLDVKPKNSSSINLGGVLNF